MRDKVGASDQIGFVLNGKPIIPGHPPVEPDQQQPPEPCEDDVSINNTDVTLTITLEN